MSDESEPVPPERPGLPLDQVGRVDSLEDPSMSTRLASTGAGGKQRKAPFVLLALLSCVCAAVVIVIALSMVRNAGEESATAAAAPASLQRPETTEATTTSSAVEAPATTETRSTRATLPPSTQSVVREASLYSNLARLRGSPTLAGAVLTTLENRDGTSLRVLGDHENGWYLIEVDGVRGWIFGAFILPPDSDLTVAVTRSGSGAQLLDADGSALGRTNSSGNKVIITAEVADLFEVLLPEGDVAYVAKSAVLVVS